MNHQTSDAERYERERSFHDHAYGHDHDAPRITERLYSANRPLEEDYFGILESIPPGTMVLEYGCGVGSRGFELAKQGAIVTGIDISPVAVEHATDTAAEQGLANLTFITMNAEELEFGDASFDTVCGTGILHHVNFAKAIPEITRVLKPGGRAVFVEPLGHNPLINAFRWATPKMRTPDEHPLRDHDFDTLRHHFRHLEVRPYVLLTLLAGPLKGTRVFTPTLTVLQRLDARLIARWPRLGMYAWQVVIDARN